MRNVSKEFEKTESKIFPKAVFTFADGRSLTVDDPDLFKISGNAFSDGAGQSSFPLGAAVAKTATLALWNDDDRYQSYDFYMSKFVLYAYKTLESGVTEEVLVGNFTVTTPESYGTTVEVTGIDDMYKLDTPFSPTYSFPELLSVVVISICNACNVKLLRPMWGMPNFVVQKKPENLTNRQVIGLAAQIAGGNAKFNAENWLEIKSYNFRPFETTGMLYGGIFDANIPYSTGDTADGGSFNPWNDGYECEAGNFSYMDNFHVLYDFKNDPAKTTDDVIITGVQVSSMDEENSYVFGEDGYILSLENQLAAGKEEEVAELIGEKIVGLRFRPFSGEHFSTITPEFMDLAYVIDRKGKASQTILTDVNFIFGSYTTLKCSADDPVRNSSQFESGATKAIVTARANTEKQISEYDKAVQMLTSMMANSLGLFQTVEKTESGGEIIYQHNKPTLAQSSIIWKKTENTFTVSNDGGNTWVAGIDAAGNAVVNVLSAIGIRFDWARGGNLILGGENNQDGYLIINNALGQKIGSIGNDGADLTGQIATSTQIDGVTRTLLLRYGQIRFFKDSEEFGMISHINIGGNQGLLIGTSPQTSGDSRITMGFRTGSNTYRMALQVKPYEVSDEPLERDKVVINGDLEAKTASYESFESSNYFMAYPGSTANYGRYCFTEYNDRAYMFYRRTHDRIEVYPEFYVNGNFKVSGTKNRVINTDYGEVSMQANESPECFFTDYGCATISEEGNVNIYFDPLLLDVIDSDCGYRVFVTPTSEKKVFYVKKQKNYFTVFGEPFATFDWQSSHKQFGYENVRFSVDDFGLRSTGGTDERLFRLCAEFRESADLLGDFIEKEKEWILDENY